MNRSTVAVISRIPRPGETKQRLARALGDEAATALHLAFVRDQLATCRQAGLQARLAHPALHSHADRTAIGQLADASDCLGLPGASLESDLFAAFGQLCATGQPAAVIASDVPHLRGAQVTAALGKLTEAEVVLGPSPDGGYWLVAMRDAHDLFTDIPMGTSRTREATIARAHSLGLSVAFADSIRDVDTIEDLTHVAPQLRRDSHTRKVFSELLAAPSPVPVPLPRRLHLEITNRCNSPCTTCVRTAAPHADSDLSLAQIDQLVAELPLQSVALQVNGEPLLHPELPAIVRALAARDIAVELNTNAIALRGQRADELLGCGLSALHISAEAATPNTYRKLRGVDAWQTVFENTAAFLERRRSHTGATPRVTMWMTATVHNLPELPALVDLAAELGADEVYLQRLVYFGFGLASGDSSLHGRLTGAHRELIAEAMQRADQHRLPLRACGGHSPDAMLEPLADPAPWSDCRRPWQSAVVMANGDLVPCCISTFVATPDQIHLGNLFEHSWHELWTGASLQQHRAALMAGTGPDYCRSCGLCWSL